MRRHPHPTLLIVLATGITFSANPAIAKRTAPADVPPIVYAGVRYEAPHFSNPCGQNGGCVVAYDDATGAQLWALRVYCTQYDPSLEADVQDVFITSLAVDSGRLNVTNEKNLHFALDLRTWDISGDARGCQNAVRGCTYSPTLSPPSTNWFFWTSLSLVSLAVVVRRRSRPRPKA